MNEETPRSDEAFVAEQEEAAAEEAGSIGGQGSGGDDLTDAERPVAEGGGGESEGFEQAEQLLEEHATHGESGPDPSHLAGKAEEPEAADPVHGDADEVDASGRSDPEEGHDLSGAR